MKGCCSSTTVTPALAPEILGDPSPELEACLRLLWSGGDRGELMALLERAFGPRVGASDLRGLAAREALSSTPGERAHASLMAARARLGLDTSRAWGHLTREEREAWEVMAGADRVGIERAREAQAADELTARAAEAMGRGPRL